MNRILLILCVLSISSGAYRAHGPEPAGHDPPAIRPSRPRTWSWTIPGWQPITARKFERLGEDGRMQARQLDRWAVREIRVPDDAGRLVVSLFLRLGKGQHRTDAAAYWPAVLDALEAAGVVAEPGDVEYDGERGVNRDDVETTVELREGK